MDNSRKWEMVQYVRSTIDNYIVVITMKDMAWECGVPYEKVKKLIMSNSDAAFALWNYLEASDNIMKIIEKKCK